MLGAGWIGRISLIFEREINRAHDERIGDEVIPPHRRTKEHESNEREDDQRDAFLEYF